MVEILDRVKAILLDIEGTTTPIDYVFGTLFPFAHQGVAAFLASHSTEPEVQADIAQLRQDYRQDLAKGIDLPLWTGPDATAPVPYIQYLITQDRKSTGLKALQGKIWQQGYQDGRLQSVLFADVRPAFEQWMAAGKALYIYSSGSIQAQQLLFRYSEAGDLTPLIQGYFDTQIGPKQDSASYAAIAAQIGIPPAEILFISDVTAELQAAQKTGMWVLCSIRTGNRPLESTFFPSIDSFHLIS
ncbi:MAG: acireductone synthase [Acaryochloridaceae cyanobacterium SU_2_1]|nr:acireductone synthase [Acaryochloridaceae cyanobacterium SU_2_1]